VRRSRVIAVAVMLGVVGAVLPIAGMLYVSWSLAFHAEERRLSDFAGKVIARANQSLSQISGALITISGSTAQPCSAEHIAAMRRMSFNTPSIQEIGYFENGLLACTSWGMTTSRIEYIPGNYTIDGGIEVTIRMTPLVTGGKPMMALHYGHYNALVDPLRFVDVIVDPGIRLAIATERGEVIGELNTPDADLLKSIMATRRSGMTDESLYGVSHGEGWLAIAIEPREGMLARLRRERLVMLPIGALISLLIVGLVVVLSRRRLSPEGELAMAVEQRQFIVHYQPIMELKSGRCVGCEALVRWRRPDGSLVSPDQFIPLAEETGLIMPITDQVVATVVAELGLQLIADRSLHVAINLSAADIKTGRILPVLSAALENTGIQPRQIWLEATERGFMDIDSAKATITLARQLGHAVAIDDFGTGYSSLQYLEGLPLNVLKIDKAFVDPIGLKTATSTVISHIIDMARALNLQMVAEGVETEEQLDYLLAHDVEFAQGWLFSRPVPAKDFVAFYLRNRERRDLRPKVLQGAA